MLFLVFVLDDGGYGADRVLVVEHGRYCALLWGVSAALVDLCDRGDLICVRVGSHRRVPRSELERLLGAAHGGKLTRDQERLLWLHRAVLAELVENPEDILARAGGNLQRLRAQHTGRGMTAHWLDHWQQVLDAGVDAVADVLTSQGPEALELRQNSPLAGVISAEVRSRVLASFVRHWRRDDGRPGKVTTGGGRHVGRVGISG